MNYLPSIIISGTNPDFRQANLDKILSALKLPTQSIHPDIRVIDHQTGWGIDQIRRLRTITQSRPIKANHRAIIIHQAQNLTIQAQNSLLKILEEPPANNTFVLLANNLSSLTDTIKSRCQIIRLNQAHKSTQSSIEISHKLSDNLNLSAQVGKDKNGCLAIIRNQIVFYQKQLLSQPLPGIKCKIRLLQKSVNMINANVNPISALDFFFLSLR